MDPEATMTRKAAELRQILRRIVDGSPEGIRKQHEAGKLTARERISRLLDPGTFAEIGLLRKHRCTDLGMTGRDIPSDGVITGHGTIEGRPVFVYAQDFSVMGGSVGETHAEKISRLLDLSVEAGAPVIGLNDSAGARIQEGVDALSGFGRIFHRNVKASGVVPQITAIMGPCAGGAAYSPALTDFIVMVDKTSQIFITGPSVTKSATGQSATMEELGGAEMHSRVSGVADLLATNDEECILKIKRLLSYLPSNNRGEPSQDVSSEPPESMSEEIVPTDPKRGYDIREVLRRVVDKGEFLELKPNFAPNIVIGFARVDGRAVGVLANQPRFLAGCLDINASDKGARFVRFCDSFNIPLITFVDVSGYLPGVEQEQGGIIRHGAKLLYAYSEATVPKITLILRKAYGGAYIAMCSKEIGADVVFALPTAEIAVMGPEGAVDFVYRREIESCASPEKARAEKTEEYRLLFANPFRAAARGYVDAVLESSEIRPRLIMALKLLSDKRSGKPILKKHGNMPM